LTPAGGRTVAREGGRVADHEGELEQVRPTELRNLVVSGFAHDRASKTAVQVAILVNNAVRTTVTANLLRPDGKKDGFSATITAPGQPANVCARTVVGQQPRAGLMLGSRPPFAVPISVVGESGAPASGQVASFFWLDSRGDIAKDPQTVPTVNGVARYTDRPIPRQLQWAITVHDPIGRPIFRSSPLVELPCPASDISAGARINVFRSTVDAGTGLNSEDAGIGLLRRRPAQLQHPLRFESVEVRGDGNGHEVVVVIRGCRFRSVPSASRTGWRSRFVRGARWAARTRSSSSRRLAWERSARPA
jgi:hypothetical protein